MLSINMTREFPLLCPGCNAFDHNHIGGAATLRSLNDGTGRVLIHDGVLELMDRARPWHLSIEALDSLVRHRELESMVSQLLDQGMRVQVITSAFRRIPAGWAKLTNLNIVVFIPERDVRRAPATYARIIKNIERHDITIHCGVNAKMLKKPGYLRQVLEFWTRRPETRKVWFGLFTPQIRDQMREMLRLEEREQVIAEMLILRKEFVKLEMPESMIRQFVSPAPSRLFAVATKTRPFDQKAKIDSRFGGTLECDLCGCIVSMDLAAVAAHKLADVAPRGAVRWASIRIGWLRAKISAPLSIVSDLR
jgi:hypothetical protein